MASAQVGLSGFSRSPTGGLRTRKRLQRVSGWFHIPTCMGSVAGLRWASPSPSLGSAQPTRPRYASGVATCSTALSPLVSAPSSSSLSIFTTPTSFSSSGRRIRVTPWVLRPTCEISVTRVRTSAVGREQRSESRRLAQSGGLSPALHGLVHAAFFAVHDLILALDLHHANERVGWAEQSEAQRRLRSVLGILPLSRSFSSRRTQIAIDVNLVERHVNFATIGAGDQAEFDQ